MKQRKLGLTIIASLLFVFFAAVPACSPASTFPTQPPVTSKPATFEVGPITLSPSTVMVGDAVTVIATVRNTGDVAGTYHAVLLIDGQPADSKDIDVAP
ncbi:MAG TPA: hypothetical protein VF366_00870, partial [Dehalococcoidia bacterium]